MVLLSCIQWFRNGDHPEDHDNTVDIAAGYRNYYEYLASPGAIVAPYKETESKSNGISGLMPRATCCVCKAPADTHGVLTHPSPGSPILVCPGNFIAHDASGYFVLSRNL